MKWYHASPKRHKKGDIIVGKSCGWSSRVPMVFLTTSPIPHYTVFDRASNEGWFVYRVIPLAKVKIGRCWDEGLCSCVEIVERVGNARGLCNRERKKQSHYALGSMVFWKGRRR